MKKQLAPIILALCILIVAVFIAKEKMLHVTPDEQIVYTTNNSNI